MLHPFLLLLLFIPQHVTLQGLKEGFSWHGVNSNSECSILESNQGGLGPWSVCKAEESCPLLPLSQAPPVLSWDPAAVQLIHQHVFFSLKNKSTKQEWALESLCKNYLKKQALFMRGICS